MTATITSKMVATRLRHVDSRLMGEMKSFSKLTTRLRALKLITAKMWTAGKNMADAG